MAQYDPSVFPTQRRGETSGSPQRPPERLSGLALSFDVADALASLKQEASWQHGDRNARTLAKEGGLRIVLTALRAGAGLDEHRTEGQVSIQVLAGHVRVQLPGQAVDLPNGRLLVLASAVPHQVEAIEESAFLLTIAE